LSYDFATINNANNYQRVVVFFDFGNPGTGAELYDDIELVSGAETLVLPLTFESAKLTYSFGNFGGANTAVVANKCYRNNTSAKVALQEADLKYGPVAHLI
jgi:hypothetical protein